MADIIRIGVELGFPFIQVNTNGIRMAKDEAHNKGMFSSIQKELQSMRETIEAFYMHPVSVDIPLVKVETLERLYAAHEREKKGHPPLISLTYKEKILSSDGEGGLKKVLQSFSDDALHVKVCEQSV